MRYRRITITVLLLAVFMVATADFESLRAAGLETPRSLKFEHEVLVDRLTQLANRGGAAGDVATRALPVVNAHFAKEAEFIFPTLGLLPEIAAGRITPEMKAAILMADRTKAAEKEVRSEHMQLTSLMNELIEAANKENDRDIVDFATSVAVHSLNEMEVLLPAAIVIGDYLRTKFPSGQ
jgi:hypothetical protein